jgi:integrase
MTPQDLEAFKARALTRYTARSVAKLASDVRTMVANKGEPPEAQRRIARLKDYAWAWDVWGDAREEITLPELPIPRPVVPAAPKRGGRRAREPKRLRESKAMTSSEFEVVLGALEAEQGSAARVVELMLRTGLRYADVARVRIDALRSALHDGESLPIIVKGDKPAMVKLGPALDAWTRAYASAFVGAVTLADAVTGVPNSDTEANGAAYERCRRVIKRIGAKHVEGRSHLHRLRHTVGIELLRRGASIEDVSQALIHDSVKTTERSYTDEYRAEQAAGALERLNRKG